MTVSPPVRVTSASACARAPRALGERLHLEGTHRTVPEDRAAVGELLGEQGARRRPDVEPHARGRDGRGRHDPVLGVGTERVGGHDVDRQHDLDALLLGAFEVALDRVDLLGLEQALAHLVTLRRQEGEDHAPPISSRSAEPSRLPMTPSLSETFAPPSTTAYGRSASVVRRRSTLTSASTSPPVACGSSFATSYTEACSRCTTPKPSETKTSAREASWPANSARSASDLPVSPGLKRRFSSSSTPPSGSDSAAAFALGPTVSSAKVTGISSTTPRRWATGAREYFASGSPLGRPRWAHTMTRAPI